LRNPIKENIKIDTKPVKTALGAINKRIFKTFPDSPFDSHLRSIKIMDSHITAPVHIYEKLYLEFIYNLFLKNKAMRNMIIFVNIMEAPGALESIS